MFREVWKTVETEVGEIGVVKTKRREKTGRKGAEEERKEEEPKKNRIIKVKKVVEKWKIWNDEEEVEKSGEETKKLVP